MIEIAQNKLNDLRTFAQNILVILDGLVKKKDFKILYPFYGNYKITQRFGENADIYKPMGYAGHFGIDFATPFGTKIYACDSGEICRSGFTSGNGNFIEIKHEWGKSLYMHFKNKPIFKVGDKVDKISILGHAGNTGFVIPTPTKSKPYAGTHLHFSIKLLGVSNPNYKNFIDPHDYLKVR